MISPIFLLTTWAQTIPVALLMFSAFEDGALRRRRYICWLLSVGCFLLACVVLALISWWARSEDGIRSYPVQDGGMAVILVLYLWGWNMIVKAPPIHKLMVAVALIHYAAALQALGSDIAALVIGDRDRYIVEILSEDGSLHFLAALLAVTVLTWPLVWRFCRNILRKSLPVLEAKESRRGLGYICLMFLLFCYVSQRLPYYTQPIATIMIVSLVLSEMLTYYIFFREIATVRKQVETARELAVWQTQYQQLSQRMEEARRLRHDLRHHLNTLGALNAQGRQEEIADYLKQYGTVYDRLEEQKFSGDPVVDSVLEYYLAQAGEEGIAVKCRVSLEGGGSSVDAMDMTVLLGNCLENALEALRPLPAEARWLSVEIAPRGVMLLVRIVNTCGNLEDGGDFAGWEAFPSCKGKGRKGVGLRSVAAIAEKYGGSAQFQRKNGEFTARISLCMCWQNDIG